MKNVFLTLLTSLLFGTSTFFRKIAVDKIHPYQLQIIAGAIYGLEVPLWLWLLRREGVNSYDPSGVGHGVLCILTAATAAVLFSYLLKVSDSPSVVSMAVASNPIVALLLTHTFLGEEITVKKVVGCGVTIAGLTLLSK
jgi:uncharacterized membrane protein